MKLIDYLIWANIIGCILYIINTWLYSNTSDMQIDVLLTICALAGGSAGIVLAILLFDRKSVKGNMMSRVFVICVLVVQIIIYLILKGKIQSDLEFAIWNTIIRHKALLIYLLAINIISLIIYGIDKLAAIGNRSRIRIVTLLGLAFMGGSIGALIAMYAFKHKIRQDYFAVGVPMILIMQIFLLFYIGNSQF